MAVPEKLLDCKPDSQNFPEFIDSLTTLLPEAVFIEPIEETGPFRYQIALRTTKNTFFCFFGYVPQDSTLEFFVPLQFITPDARPIDEEKDRALLKKTDALYQWWKNHPQGSQSPFSVKLMFENGTLGLGCFDYYAGDLSGVVKMLRELINSLPLVYDGANKR